ncbi:DDE-1 domain-containing protein [Caerostris extrusa]|uniref:DDE-1 domain-containing protein n=1 Tax=Caerostris extrusa TaxID=172846 RepID=A0AAV4X9I5_CAEEX|nr:DDE-1 domain-containing protein [Caerostris extrusa]
MSRKINKRQYRCTTYTAEAMRLAFQSVRSGQYTGRRAAAEFNVPYGTLNKKLSGRAPVEAHGAGRPIEITVKNEQKFAERLAISGNYGYGYSRNEIKELVAEFVKQEDIKTRWTDGKPGYEWLKNFLKRHPEVKVRKDEHFTHKRLEGVDPFSVYRFYDDLERLYQNEKLTDSNIHRIYNVAKVSFHDDSEEVLLSRCSKCVMKIPQNDEKMETSVIVCVGADGKKLHPLIVFPGRCMLPSRITNKSLPGTAYYTASAMKWMEGSLFNYWFEHVFISQIPSLIERCGKSVILLFDGSSLHISIQVLTLAVKHNVIFVKLPPKLSNHLQPMSRTCLATLNSAWDERLLFWTGESLSTTQKLFGQLVGIIWNQHFGKRIVKKAFETTGIFPPNRKKFPENTFSLVSLKRYIGRSQYPVKRVKVGNDQPSSAAEDAVDDSVDSNPVYEIAKPSAVSKKSASNLFQQFLYKKRSPNETPMDQTNICAKRKKIALDFQICSIQDWMVSILYSFYDEQLHNKWN